MTAAERTELMDSMIKALIGHHCTEGLASYLATMNVEIETLKQEVIALKERLAQAPFTPIPIGGES